MLTVFTPRSAGWMRPPFGSTSRVVVVADPSTLFKSPAAITFAAIDRIVLPFAWEWWWGWWCCCCCCRCCWWEWRWLCRWTGIDKTPPLPIRLWTVVVVVPERGWRWVCNCCCCCCTGWCITTVPFTASKWLPFSSTPPWGCWWCCTDTDWLEAAEFEEDDEEQEDEEEGEADEELGDCCEAAVVVETVVVCVTFCCCPLRRRSSVKVAALILLRRLQPFPLVSVLLWVFWWCWLLLLLQLMDMHRSDVLLLFVEALLISWPWAEEGGVVVERACISHICSWRMSSW